MANVLSQISQGLRGAAGILNNDVQRETEGQDNRLELARQQMLQQALIQQPRLAQSERHFQQNQALEEKKLIETIKERGEARKLREQTSIQLHLDKLDLANREYDFKGQQLKQNYDLRMSQLGDQRARDAATAEYRRDELIRRKQQDEVNAELRRLGLEAQKAKLETGGLAGEAAGKIAMADQAVLDIRDTRNILFDSKGELNRSLIAAMNIPFTAGLPGHAEARSAYSKIHNAVAAKLRIETGAAATESEVKGILNRFLPKVSDPASVVTERLNSLETFMNTTIDQTKGVRMELLKSRKPKASDVDNLIEKYRTK